MALLDGLWADSTVAVSPIRPAHTGNHTMAEAFRGRLDLGLRPKPYTLTTGLQGRPVPHEVAVKHTQCNAHSSGNT